MEPIRPSLNLIHDTDVIQITPIENPLSEHAMIMYAKHTADGTKPICKSL